MSEEKLDKLLAQQATLLEEIREVKEKVDNIGGRLEAVEGDIKEIKLENESLKREIVELKLRTKVMETDMEYQRNQSRRNNLVFVGIPEMPGKESKRDCKSKVWEICKDKLDLDMDVNEIERAHRTESEVYPRPIKVRFFSTETKDEILNNSKKLKGTKIRIYEDFAKNTVVARKKLMVARKEFRDADAYARVFYDKLVVRKRGSEYQETYQYDEELKKVVKRSEKKIMQKGKRDRSLLGSGGTPEQINKQKRGDDVPGSDWNEGMDSP